MMHCEWLTLKRHRQSCRLPQYNLLLQLQLLDYRHLGRVRLSDLGIFLDLLTVDSPTKHARTRCEATDGVQEHCSIFGVCAFRPPQHSEANDGSGQDTSDEDASLAYSVTGPA